MCVSNVSSMILSHNNHHIRSSSSLLKYTIVAFNILKLVEI